MCMYKLCASLYWIRIVNDRHFCFLLSRLLKISSTKKTPKNTQNKQPTKDADRLFDDPMDTYSRDYDRSRSGSPHKRLVK